MLLFASNLAGTKLISCLAVVHLMRYRMKYRMCDSLKLLNVAGNNVVNRETACESDPLSKASCRAMDLHHNCTIVHKQYKPYTLRIIYSINLFFFANSCVPNGRIISKICVSCFFCDQKKTLWN